MEPKFLTELKNFVCIKCEGRDQSHGDLHAKAVAKVSKQIYKELSGPNIDSEILKLVLTVAWLHDVADHKYFPTKEIFIEMKQWLSKYFIPDDVQLIMNIIERISYSKENYAIVNNLKLDWIETIGELGIRIRDIVSDADKLEALGKNGLVRCCVFTKEAYHLKTQKVIPYEKLVRDVHTHAEEKLLRLAAEFIRTQPGKELAQPLHEELIQELDNLKYLSASKLSYLAPGLNIEGGNPARDLNSNSIWACLCVVLDRPLIDNISFDNVMASVKKNNYPLLENAIPNLNEKQMFSQMLCTALYYVELMIKKSLTYLTIHVHQDIIAKNLITIFDSHFKKLMDNIGIKYENLVINYRTDTGHYLKTSVNNDKIDVLISFSQCAGLDANLEPGSMLVPNEFIPMTDDRILCRDIYQSNNDLANHIEDVVKVSYHQYVVDYINDNYVSAKQCQGEARISDSKDFVISRLLQVSDLWCPSEGWIYKLEL